MLREKEKDSRCIQETSAPVTVNLYEICNVSDLIYATLPPLATLHKIKVARTSELRKPNKDATDKGLIWPTDGHDAGNSPETYTIPGNIKVIK